MIRTVPNPRIGQTADRGIGVLVQRCGGESCACHYPSNAPSGAAVRVGRSNDEREDEADRVADLVLRAVKPSGVAPDVTGRIRREATDEDRLPVANTRELFPPEALVQDAEEEQTVASEVVQRKPAMASKSSSALDLDARIARTVSGGHPLSQTARDFMEPRFRHVFADVRIHNDAESAALCDDLSARAFTLGRDIYFSRGEFSPGTSVGDRLLAHELTHVVQQRGERTMVARDCQYVATHAAPDTYCQTEEEARARVTRACPPDRADFLYRDGPEDRPWRPIPGYGCAHYVAHRLGITNGRAWENCRSGNSVTIGQITSGLVANPLANARVNDIWVTNMVHSGVVTGVVTNAAGQVTRAHVDHVQYGGQRRENHGDERGLLPMTSAETLSTSLSSKPPASRLGRERLAEIVRPAILPIPPAVQASVRPVLDIAASSGQARVGNVGRPIMGDPRLEKHR